MDTTISSFEGWEKLGFEKAKVIGPKSQRWGIDELEFRLALQILGSPRFKPFDSADLVHSIHEHKDRECDTLSKEQHFGGKV